MEWHAGETWRGYPTKFGARQLSGSGPFVFRIRQDRYGFFASEIRDERTGERVAGLCSIPATIKPTERLS